MSSHPPVPHSVKRVLQRAKEMKKAHRRGDTSVCPLLRLLPKFKAATDETILRAPIQHSSILWALAIEAGFNSWNKHKQHLVAAATAAPTVAAPPVAAAPAAIPGASPSPDLSRPVSLPLFADGRPEHWWILDGAGRIESHAGVMVIRSSGGAATALHALVGGMSWDCYRFAVEFRLQPGASLAGFGLLIRAACSDDSCALFGNTSRHILVDLETRQRITHLAGVPLTEGDWHTLEATFDERGSGYSFNGKPVHFGRHHDWDVLPRVPHGFVEIAVEAKTSVEFRNAQVTFLKPTAKQLAEAQTSARVNLEPHVRLHRPAS